MSPQQKPNDDDTTTRLVVGNLSRNMTEDHVREIFSLYGILKVCACVRDFM